MAKKSTPPEVTPDDMNGTKQTHPSFGVVQINRVSGFAELFDSPFRHQHFIALNIRRAEKHGDGSHDFIFGRESLIEVYMSETQFARAITSMNMGSGAPCTLNRVGKESIPAPEIDSMTQIHETMVEEKLTNVMDKQRAVADKMRAWREAKHRPTLKELDALVSDMDCSTGNFESNMGFYARCFEEHMEKVVDTAKGEIEAHMLASAGKLGLSVDEIPNLELNDGRDTDGPVVDVE